LSTIDPNIPIIALTALVMPSDRRKCLDAGMDAYVPKPVDVKKLQEVFVQVLSKRELEAIQA
jgi:CheY-like chemotaxis protein